MRHQLLDSTVRRLDRMAVERQRESRTPALAAGVAHRGDLLWSAGVGTADLADPTVPLDERTQFLIASNTKTFTAVMVLQLRDEGRLRLDDPIDDHLPGSRQPGVTIRQLLAHASGMQREPVRPEFWDTLAVPPADRFVEDWNASERVLPPHAAWHYSNLAFIALGEVVAHADGRSWAESLQARLLDPLGLTRTTLALQPPAAGLYFVPPYSDVPVDEPVLFTGILAAAGGLASTVADLATWHGFLLDPDESVLRRDTALEMREPHAARDPRSGTMQGLGLALVHREGRTWFGHTGGAPGGITGAYSDPESGLTGVVLMNNSVARTPESTAIGFAEQVAEHDAPLPEPWTPGTEAPEDLVPLTGLWFSEGSAFVFRIRGGRLEAVQQGADDDAPPAVFEPEGRDALRTVSGRERGERLLVDRRDDGSIRLLSWATYRCTREPLGFGEPAV
ncbi:serine hydrolase domain-containing protein [Amnibacterium endophyticum]|uniref:Serine hydrolase domain-containing protein n=1 Tax=Amnibacterium endophyticum TaxID=2109337 RepID=A0ABW4LBM5_9MICO